MDEHELLTYCWHRDEPWQSHKYKELVRTEIEWDGSWSYFKVFSRGVYPDGATFYMGVDRSQWFEMFGVEG